MCEVFERGVEVKRQDAIVAEEGRDPSPLVGRERRKRTQFAHAARAAAVKPERMAPSMVAGQPVSVQSPASTRLRQRVRALGRRSNWAGVAAKVARFSFTTRCGGRRSGSR